MTPQQKQAQAKRYREKHREKRLRHSREYYKKNRESELKRAALYRKKNAEKILQFAKKRYWSDPEKARAKHNQWRAENTQKALSATLRWRRMNPESYRISARKSELKRRHGITLEEYDRMFQEQRGRCQICKNKGAGTSKYYPLDIDHCHLTGKIRGLLCGLCNRGIGQLKDSPAILRAAVAYLEKAR